LSTARTVAISAPVASTAAARVASIDIFRGLTIAVMIFVNELAEVRGLPWWTYHAHGDQNVMTYVDMVFPFFLFIVGMSMPLSVEHRLKRNPSVARLWMHVLVRSFSLLVLGLILANADKADPAHMPMNGYAWGLLALIGACLYLNVYPKSGWWARNTPVWRGIGLLVLVAAFAILRGRAHDGQLVWIDFSYPEILGLIAFAYFTAALLYIPARRWKGTPLVVLVLMLGLNVAYTAKILVYPHWLSQYEWPFGNGSHTALVMAGILTVQIFLGVRPGTDERPPAKRATLVALVFAVLAFLAGWLTAPLGISKIRATPAWTLWDISAAVLAFTLLYWICDQWQKNGWAGFVRPAGANTLLTYLLPDGLYFLLGAYGITTLNTHFQVGWPGVAKSVVFTFAMLGLAWLLTRARVRLQL